MQLNRATVLAILVTLSMAAPSSKKDKHDKDHKNDKDDGAVMVGGGYAAPAVSCPLSIYHYVISPLFQTPESECVVSYGTDNCSAIAVIWNPLPR